MLRLWQMLQVAGQMLQAYVAMAEQLDGCMLECWQCLTPGPACLTL